MYNDYPLGMTELDAVAYAVDSCESLIDFIQNDMDAARAFMAATHPGEGWD